MARVENMERIGKTRPQIHGAVECTYFDFIGEDGRRYLTIETYGSPDRDMPNKVSQSFQFDEAAAEHLVRVIRSTFPAIRP